MTFVVQIHNLLVLTLVQNVVNFVCYEVAALSSVTMRNNHPGEIVE